MATTLTYKEMVDNEAPSTWGCSPEGGRALMSYIVDGGTGVGGAVGPKDLQTMFTEVLGTITDTATDGKIKRTPPLAHPVFPYWYASNIGTVQGVGGPSVNDAVTSLGIPTVAQFALYQAYKLTVEFTPRPYAVLLDNQIQLVKTGSWYDDTGSPQDFTYVKEWERNTDYWYDVQGDWITGVQGTIHFSTQSGGAPNNYIFPGAPRQYLPNRMLTVRWYQVPYRYVTSSHSYLNRWLGRVNQNAWYDWGPGELLYLNYKPRRYTPPVQTQTNFWSPGVFSTEKWCDLELFFLHTKRTGTDLPVSPSSGNLNDVIGGHNLFPWLKTREFFYAETASSAAFWPSFPVELLFMDPDVDNGAIW